jgi:hypothetical protein
MTFGGKVITKAVMESVGNVNFLARDLFRMLLEPLNLTIFPGFAMTYLTGCDELLSNFEHNARTLGIKNLTLGRFVTLVMPLFLPAHENSKVIATFLRENPGSGDLEDFGKLAGNRLLFDKCPLAIWFWCGKHHIPSSLVFSAIGICHAWVRLMTACSIPQWVFINVPDCWLDTIAFNQPNVCLQCRNVILSSGALSLMGDSQFDLSHTELSKIYVFKGMQIIPFSEMKADLYEYMMDTEKPTIDGFRESIQRKHKQPKR